MAPVAMPPDHDDFPDGLPPTATKREVVRAQARAGEKRCQELLARMTPERRDAYLALSNCHEGDGSGPLTGRFRTNGLGGPGDYKFMDLPGEAGTFSFVADDISRANHSCRPNAYPHFDCELFAIVLRAVRPIKAGEEICISYLSGGVDTYEERKKSLSSYGFECTCSSCVDHVASDARRAIIATFNDPQPVNSNPYYHIKRNLWKISLIQEEGLEELTDYLSLHLQLSMSYRMVGDSVKAAEVKKREDQLNWVNFNRPAMNMFF
ncbi:hypothetical protein BD626DRAFT_411009 [Schizophyllum amplum]|uniref:SET domain-containing protein n=1 Tax=Schizophyllum amplum TaxID=97359 RepID=A0A550BZY3_9AGAR|nr:hypothetical protein BD626DRAFT_411009 [Auriculariopsis ampla]